MSSLAEIVISFIDLLEAELGQARRAIFRLGLGLGILAICAAMALGGVAVLFYAWFIFISARIGQAPGALLTAVIMLAGAGGLLWLAKKLATK